jgi:hypothetical protein
MVRLNRSASVGQQITTANNYTVKQDPSGYLGLFNTSGTEVAYFDNNGNIIFLGTTMGAAASVWIGNDTTGLGIALNAATGGALRLKINNSNRYVFSTNGVTVFGSNPTAGLGLPPIYTAYQSGSTNAALTAVGSYTPPAAAGLYRVMVHIYCTVGTATSFSVKVNYKDLNGTAHADIFPLASAAAPGVFLTNGLVIAAGTYYSLPLLIAIDNSQTPITFSTVGTFTTVTYFLDATLEQLA